MSTILYYSNFCQHSKSLIQHVSKNPELTKDIHFICIDKRIKTPDNKTKIVLENGQQIAMPDNLNMVPALLLLNDNYRIIYGDEILTHLHPQMKQHGSGQPSYSGEPMGFHLGTSAGGTNIISEQYTDYSMTPDELSAKGKGSTRQMYNYVSVNQDTIFIETPPDNYTPDKVSGDVTVDTLQQQRLDEIGSQTNSNQVQPRLQSTL